MERKSFLSFMSDPAEQERIRREAGIKAPRAPKEEVETKKKGPAFVNDTVARPTFVSDDRQRQVAFAQERVAKAYRNLAVALKDLKDLSGAMPDPATDANQLLFPFATQFVSRHEQMLPSHADVGLNGTRTTLVIPPARAREVTKMIIPECRACHVRLIPPVAGRGYKSENAEKRMEKIFGVIYSESDSI